MPSHGASHAAHVGVSPVPVSPVASDVGSSRKAASSPTRTTFRHSRLLDLFSERELITQMGHSPSLWPLAALKELIDNGLDACEDAGIAPEITVQVDGDRITVQDNGPGIPPTTVEGMCDFTVRTSSRAGYVSPTRGQQGNALQTLTAVPYVLGGEKPIERAVEIEACGVRHVIAVRVDHVEGKPVISHEQHPSNVKSGTLIRLAWPD